LEVGQTWEGQSLDLQDLIKEDIPL
jgi:hypothetical protein